MAESNESADNNVCDSAKKLAKYDGFELVFIFQIFAAPFGVFMNLIMFWLVCRRSLYHLNLKILLAHLHIMIIWYCCGLAFKSVHVLHWLRTDPCELITNQYGCKGVEIVIYIFPLYNTVYALVIIEIEQFYGIWKCQTDAQMKNVWLPILLIIVSWLITLTPQVTPFLAIFSQDLMPMCMNLLTLGRSGLIFLIGTAGSMEIFAVLLSFINYFFCSLKVKHYVINRAHYSLRNRFTLLQTMTMSKTVLPASFLHCLIWIPFLVSLLYLGLDFDADYPTRVILINTAYLFGMVFANVYPIIILTQNAGIWYKFKMDVYNACRCANCILATPRGITIRRFQGHEASTAHFDYLEMIWKKP